MSLRTGIALLLGVVLSSAPGTVTFERTWFPGYLRVIEQTPDDGYILTFKGHDSVNEQVGTLLKTDSLGNIEWWRQYHSGYGHGASFNCVCATLDGGYIGAGYMSTGSAAPPWAVKTDSVGDTLWTYVGSGWSRFFSAVATPDSGCVLAGRLSDGGKQGMGLLKLSRNGQREWLRIFSPAGMYTSYGYVTRATDGRGFFVNGTIDEDTSGAINDNYIVRTDSIGETIWTVRYRPEIPDYYGFWLGAGCVTADGGYAICGMAATPLRHPSFVARFDSTGAHLWTRVLFDTTSPWPDHPLARIQATPDGGFIVVGSQYPGSSLGVLLIRLDSLGDTLWTRLFDGLDPQLEDQGEWVINTHDGGFAVCGTADRDQYAYLIKTDSMGMVYNAVSERRPSPLPEDMLTAEPNPFRSAARLSYEIPVAARIALNVYDRSGRLVAVLVSGQVTPGRYNLTWHATDREGRPVAPGVYFCRLLNLDSGASWVQKLTLVR
jgi:hypothetical protein